MYGRIKQSAQKTAFFKLSLGSNKNLTKIPNDNIKRYIKLSEVKNKDIPNIFPKKEKILALFFSAIEKDKQKGTTIPEIFAKLIMNPNVK